MDLENAPIIMLTATSISSWGPALANTESAAPQSEWLRAGRGMDFQPLVEGRRSVRDFQDREVPRAALESMINAAGWAPSPHGRQPWRFVVLTRSNVKERLAATMGDDWRAILAQDGQPGDIINLRLEKSRQRIREAPALILACLYLDDLDRYPDLDRQRAEEIMAIQSLGAAIQNMLLTAYAIGLDTGWMCAPLFSPDAARAALDLDSRLIPHALIPVGYAARDPKRRPHRPLEELVALWE
jgi:F420 biosynthesis protein FbiB-like protein